MAKIIIMDQKGYKTFSDLVFKPYPCPTIGTFDGCKNNEKIAQMNFSNSYGISVILGKSFGSNGVDTYEVALLKDGVINYRISPTNDIIGYATEDKVTELMVYLQNLTDDK